MSKTAKRCESWCGMTDDEMCDTHEGEDGGCWGEPPLHLCTRACERAGKPLNPRLPECRDNRRRTATDWNRCPKCNELVDLPDEAHDGSECRCHGCKLALVVVELTVSLTDSRFVLDAREAHPGRSAPAPAVEGEPPGEFLGLEEAMCCIHDGKPVQMRRNDFDGALWVDVVRDGHLSVEVLAAGALEFRLKPQPAPALTRVQEMAREFAGTILGADARLYAEFGERTVRAVCKWLRVTEAGHMIDHDLPGKAEREFLGPGEGSR